MSAILLMTSLYVAAVTAGYGPDGCPENFYRFDFPSGAKCLKYVEVPMMYYNAKQYCSELQGETSLLMAKSEEINDYLAQFGIPVWLGLEKHGDTWQWSCGQNLTGWTNWARGEPAEDQIGPDCGQMTRTGRWKDVRCISQAPFVCQAEPAFCPPGYDVVGDRCLDHWRPRKTFLEAAADCETRNASLVTDITPELNKALAGWVALRAVREGYNIWIGLTNMFQADPTDFVWVNDDKPAAWTNWGAGRPFAKSKFSRCATVNRYNQTWFDFSCASKRVHYACEVDRLDDMMVQ